MTGTKCKAFQTTDICHLLTLVPRTKWRTATIAHRNDNASTLVTYVDLATEVKWNDENHKFKVRVVTEPLLDLATRRRKYADTTNVSNDVHIHRGQFCTALSIIELRTLRWEAKTYRRRNAKN